MRMVVDGKLGLEKIAMWRWTWIWSFEIRYKALIIEWEEMLISHVPRYSSNGGLISMSLFAYSWPWSSAGEFGRLTCIGGWLSWLGKMGILGRVMIMASSASTSTRGWTERRWWVQVDFVLNAREQVFTGQRNRMLDWRSDIQGALSMALLTTYVGIWQRLRPKLSEFTSPLFALSMIVTLCTNTPKGSLFNAQKNTQIDDTPKLQVLAVHETLVLIFGGILIIRPPWYLGNACESFCLLVPHQY
jgi:hypothetical protein